jgi:geranylgeranyl reductase family protein
LLIEKHVFPRDKACGDGLTRSSVRLLGEMGLGGDLSSHQSVRGIRVVTDTNAHRDRRYNGRDPGLPDHGVVIPRRVLDHLVSRRAVDAGATLWEGTTATAPIIRERRACGVRVVRDRLEQEISATFVVLANGHDPRLARKLGIPPGDRWSTGFAVRGYFADVEDVEDLFLVYVPLVDPDGNRMVAGYGWAFPLPGSSANIGVGYFPTHRGDLRLNLRRTFDAFLAGLRERDARFARMRLIGRLRGAPLPCGMAPAHCTGPGFLVVGDAAGLVDPFTGEGIDGALESGKLAARVLNDALASPDPARADLGEYGRLLVARYGDRFHAGQRFVRMYGFIWKLLGNTVGVSRPLFDGVRHALITYGEEDSGAPGPETEAVCPPMEGAGLSADLLEIRRQIGTIIRSEYPLLARVTAIIADPWTRTLRPALALLSGRFGTDRGPDRIVAATCVELACMAHLMLLNVLDDQTLGEGPGPPARSSGIKWGNLFALMGGNYLLTKAYELSTRLGHEITTILAETSAEISRGRIRELTAAYDRTPSEDRYLEYIQSRTASLYELPCLVGASLSGAPRYVVDALSGYGRSLGIALQLIQDVLDVLAQSETVQDHPMTRILADGLMTMPMILTLDTYGGGPLQALLGRGRTAGERVEAVLPILRENDSLPRTRAKAAAFASRAKASLECLPASPTVRTLQAIADDVLDRAAGSPTSLATRSA